MQHSGVGNSLLVCFLTFIIDIMITKVYTQLSHKAHVLQYNYSTSTYTYLQILQPCSKVAYH